MKQIEQQILSSNSSSPLERLAEAVFPKKELAQLVISACHQFNIDTIVISPGSRNAPLTIGFSNHSEIETLSVVDERCAAFFALDRKSVV